ncbi:hypothetical protein NMY22_g9651 [Coprinellus aureogranulatus]|nr:hypothetical protein NMY22_g9651 [Coprinellus aureogranulatus]
MKKAYRLESMKAQTSKDALRKLAFHSITAHQHLSLSPSTSKLQDMAVISRWGLLNYAALRFFIVNQTYLGQYGEVGSLVSDRLAALLLPTTSLALTQVTIHRPRYPDSGRFVFMPLDGGLVARKSCLSDLPDELLLLIVLKLGLGDLLRVRTTCSLLDRITCSREVWCNLFHLGLGTTLPRPFFLPKCLRDCSARDLEQRLRQWGGALPCSDPLRYKSRTLSEESPKLPSGSIFSSTILPGGRYIIAGCGDGSVWYYDLWAGGDPSTTTEVTLSCLIPSPYLNSSGFDVPIKLAVDLLSEDSLGLSLTSHHLQQFNIAVVTWRGECSINDTEINIWRVRLDEDGGGLELDEHLSTFHDAPFLHVLDCSLLGPVVAYNLGDWACAPRSVIVVEWAKARGKPRDEVPRLYIPRFPATVIRLLPGDRLVTLSRSGQMIRLYNWRSDCIPSATPSPQPPDGSVIPAWTTRATSRIIFRGDIPPPLVVGGTTRIVVGTANEVIGLTIPSDHREPRATTLLEAPFGRSGWSQAFGYCQSICVEQQSKIASFRYTWKGDRLQDISADLQRDSTDLTLSERDIFRRSVLFDQYTKSLVLIDVSLTRFFTLQM